jgi:type III secretion protein R
MTNLPSPLTLLVLLVIVGLVPFVAIMTTSYVKLVVVFGLVRNALGTQNVPPNMALNGLAIILSIYIMAPVARNAYRAVSDKPFDFTTVQHVGDFAQAAADPFREFMLQHTTPAGRSFFVTATQRLWPPDQAATVTQNDLFVLVPAFTTSELTSAFQIGFLLFLPFVVIDIIVSNILLAMGMAMVSPTTISMPFKLLLFVAINGWVELIHGLVLSYARPM